MNKDKMKKIQKGKTNRSNWPVPAKILLQYIQGDFEKLWDAAINFDGGKGAGGNYHFAFLSILFLEWICRVGKIKNGILQVFAGELNKIDPRYFMKLSKRTASISGEFKIPKPLLSGNGTFLIDMIYLQMRNGHSHVYHQNVAALRDEAVFGFGIQMLPHSIKEFEILDRSSVSHLNPYLQDNQITVTFSPALFYLDLKKAAEKAKVVEVETILEIPKVTILSDVNLETMVEILKGKRTFESH
jgi:hypothetical protein